ncbi:hypothetical protein ACFOY8_14950 [Thalassospira xianhensis]|uniref:Uncharacterized protein n=1 Tax=Thalassospira xianhensis MCCC 1A02616 TaxID=1177929 RepID=A0A367UGX2_9PROT|nr:hypothetical protein [Thalassospira xianhensis]RCK07556.1 hypothetical protein TH5_00275 [Thalassospira xianhensis MCCC 1A02616]
MIIEIPFIRSMRYLMPRARNPREIYAKSSMLLNILETDASESPLVGMYAENDKTEPRDVFYDGNQLYIDTGVNADEFEQLCLAPDSDNNPLGSVQRLYLRGRLDVDVLLEEGDVINGRIVEGTDTLDERRATILDVANQYRVRAGKIVSTIGEPYWKYRVSTSMRNNIKTLFLSPVTVPSSLMDKVIKNENFGEATSYLSQLLPAHKLDSFIEHYNATYRIPIDEINRSGVLEITAPEIYKEDLTLPVLYDKVRFWLQSWRKEIAGHIDEVSIEEMERFIPFRDAFNDYTETPGDTDLLGELTDQVATLIDSGAASGDLVKAFKAWRNAMDEKANEVASEPPAGPRP